MSTFKTDALNPSSLPTAALGRPRSLHARTQPSGLGTSGPTHKDALAKSYDEWNTRIDGEVKSLASGLKELVTLADIGENPSPHNPPVQSLDLNLTTARLIRSTQSLRDLSHELKLTLLLSDTVQAVQRRDAEMAIVRREIVRKREDAGQAVLELLQREARARGELGMGDHGLEGEDGHVQEAATRDQETIEEPAGPGQETEEQHLPADAVENKPTPTAPAEEEEDEDEGMEEVHAPEPADVEMAQSGKADTPQESQPQEAVDIVDLSATSPAEGPVPEPSAPAQSNPAEPIAIEDSDDEEMEEVS